MYADGYRPRPIDDWDDWFHEFVVTDSNLLYEVELECEHHVPRYLFGQSVTDEEGRWRRLANVCAVTVARLLDMLDHVPGRFVAPEFERVFGTGRGR